MACLSLQCAETLSQAARKADLFIVVNASTIELPDVERYIAETVGDRPLVLWNLELDTLRADLGEHAKPSMLSNPLYAGLTSLLDPAESAQHRLCLFQQSIHYVSVPGPLCASACRAVGLSSKGAAVQILMPIHACVLHPTERLLKGKASQSSNLCALIQLYTPHCVHHCYAIVHLSSSLLQDIEVRAEPLHAECSCGSLHHQLQWLHLQRVPWSLAGISQDPGMLLVAVTAYRATPCKSYRHVDIACGVKGRL